MKPSAVSQNIYNTYDLHASYQRKDMPHLGDREQLQKPCEIVQIKDFWLTIVPLLAE